MIKLGKPPAQKSTEIDTGVYATEVEIISIEDKSNYPGKKLHRTIGKRGYEPELCLIVKYKSGKYFKDLYLFGKFLKDEAEGKAIGWDGWNNSVERFMMVMFDGEVLINDDLSIPGELLERLPGKKFIKVNYISNNGYMTSDGSYKPNCYKDWSFTFSRDTVQEKIEAEWRRQSVHIKDYAPEVIISNSSERHRDEYDEAGGSDNEDIF
jgi:hypothetical protein